MGIEAITKSIATDKIAKSTKSIENSMVKSALVETIKSSQFNFTILTKEQVENDRCKAYNYAL